MRRLRVSGAVKKKLLILNAVAVNLSPSVTSSIVDAVLVDKMKLMNQCSI